MDRHSENQGDWMTKVQIYAGYHCNENNRRELYYLFGICGGGSASPGIRTPNFVPECLAGAGGEDLSIEAGGCVGGGGLVGDIGGPEMIIYHVHVHKFCMFV